MSETAPCLLLYVNELRESNEPYLGKDIVMLLSKDILNGSYMINNTFFAIICIHIYIYVHCVQDYITIFLYVNVITFYLHLYLIIYVHFYISGNMKYFLI